MDAGSKAPLRNGMMELAQRIESSLTSQTFLTSGLSFVVGDEPNKGDNKPVILDVIELDTSSKDGAETAEAETSGAEAEASTWAGVGAGDGVGGQATEARWLKLRGTQMAFAERRREEREMKRRMWLLSSIVYSLGGGKRGEERA